MTFRQKVDGWKRISCVNTEKGYLCTVKPKVIGLEWGDRGRLDSGKDMACNKVPRQAGRVRELKERLNRV